MSDTDPDLDLDALRDLPAVPFEACEHVPGQISSTALVRYRLVDYSAPTVPSTPGETSGPNVQRTPERQVRLSSCESSKLTNEGITPRPPKAPSAYLASASRRPAGSPRGVEPYI